METGTQILKIWIMIIILEYLLTLSHLMLKFDWILLSPGFCLHALPTPNPNPKHNSHHLQNIAAAHLHQDALPNLHDSPWSPRHISRLHHK